MIINSYIKYLRARIGNRKIPLVSTSAIIVNGEGKVLWEKRGDFLVWGLPGGILEPGESLPDCVRREVFEETGLKVEPVKITGIYSSPDLDVKYPNGDEAQQITVCFLCHQVGGTTKVDGTETVELSWFLPSEPPQTLIWYQAMLMDYCSHHEEVAFAHFRELSQNHDIQLTPELQKRMADQPLIIPGVRCTWFNSAGQIALVHAGEDNWILPGGIMNLGERLDFSLKLRVFESTGINIQPKRIIGVYSGPEQLISTGAGWQIYGVDFLFESEGIGHNGNGRNSKIQYFSETGLPPLSDSFSKMIYDAFNHSGKVIF